ncbi:hypothetical protein ZIOFF_018464 [Zingiber officinale]|uniref:C3H1-type domain-containing protein n=1 Tax=Zingiber officinale TaxID=94328 RepID=A0A8J5H6E1_ZINOF|nr:hypothetical protein ZIOFF_018464 [Zingiber officinale]
MDFEQPDRYGNRRGYQRAGPSQVPDRSNKVCFHWQAGRCSRHPCPFLHSDPQQTVLADGAAKRGHLQGHVSRNIASAGAPPAKWGKGRAGGKAPDKICNYFLTGNCSFGDKLTGIALPSGSDKLYSCSKDEFVHVWDTQTGKCVGAINMGGEVGCMTNEGPWLFIGVVNAVKAWNTQTTTEQGLDGPVGQVYALTVGNGMLFAGTQKQLEQSSEREKKESAGAPSENRILKKKKSKKEKSSKEQEEHDQNQEKGDIEAEVADASAVDIKERIKKVASMR